MKDIHFHAISHLGLIAFIFLSFYFYNFFTVFLIISNKCNEGINQLSIVLIAIVFKSELLHVFKINLSLIVSIENSCKGSDISSGRMKLFIH